MNAKKTGMTIRKKLCFSYFFIVVLLIVTGLIGIYYVRKVYTNSNDIYANHLKPVEYMKSISQNLKDIDKCIVHIVGGIELEGEQDCSIQIKEEMDANAQLIEQCSQINIADKKLYEECSQQILELNKQIYDFLECMDSGNQKELSVLYERDIIPARDLVYNKIESVINSTIEDAAIESADNRRIIRSTTWLISIFMVVSVVIAIVITVVMSNHFTTKLNSIQLLARRISEYNMTDDIASVGNDEFGKTMKALNESQFMVRDLLEKIIADSVTISDMGEEVSLAVRKSGQRIEHTNVRILEYDEKAKQVDIKLKEVMEKDTLDADTIALLKHVLEKSTKAKEILDESRTELSSIAMYLEQIGITSDYQNEIANRHKEQVTKFKV